MPAELEGSLYGRTCHGGKKDHVLSSHGRPVGGVPVDKIQARDGGSVVDGIDARLLPAGWPDLSCRRLEQGDSKEKGD